MSVSLVLEGGGMRGIYTCGVLDYFMDKGIKFPDIYAVSAGAGHGMSYVSNQRGRAVDVGTSYIGNWRYMSKRSLILTGNLFGKKFIYETIPAKLNPFDYEAFNNSGMTLHATVASLETGEAEYIPIKDAVDDMKYVIASSSLPLVSRIQKTPRGKFLDGGCADSIPVRKALSESDRAVVVLTQPEGFKKEPSSSQKYIAALYKRYPRFVETCEKRHENYNESLDIIDREVKSGRVLCIRPSEKLGVDRIEKDRSKLMKLYELGYRDAESSGIESFLK